VTKSIPDLCVVVPAHNERENLPVLARELDERLGAAGISYELIVVDDGSTDDTADVVRQLVQSSSAVRGLRLSRNFGHQAAISVGLTHANGRAVAIMDADLQDRPDDLVQLYRRWQQGADVVYAVRRNRKEGVLLRNSYRFFYRLLARTASVPIPVDSGDFCVMSGHFVDRLNALPERLRYVRGLRAWLGGKQVPLPVERDARRAGRPQYTVAKLFRLAVDGLVSFSYVPLRVASTLGFIVAAFAFIGVAVVLIWHLTGLLPSGAGLATIALGVFFLGGVQLIAIGIVGEYLGRVFDEVKGRPVAVVEEEITGDGG
jgi:dolichol-phosphate mannosyltransferase